MAIAPGVSVLTGRNNVGKSRVLTQIMNLPSAVGNPGFPAAPAIRVTQEDGVSVATDPRGSPPPMFYQVVESGRTVIDAKWAYANGRMEFGYQTSNGPTVVVAGGVAALTHLGALPHLSRVTEAVARFVYLPPQRVIAGTVSTVPVDVPNTRGGDLGQAIYKHRNAVSSQFMEFEAAVSEILPEVSMVLTDPVPGQNNVTIKLRDRLAGFDVPIDDAGTGVTQLLHLIATVLFSPDGRVLLVDEPQLHLHPGAEKLLARFIRAHPEHDYVMATHSPLFINALDPDRAWLLTRDADGTHIRSVFQEQLPKVHLLQELGISPGDVALAERLLFVEGPADVETYPVLMRRLDWDPIRLSVSVIQLQGGDTARPMRDVVAELSRLLNMRMVILLDGDKKGEVEESEVVRFLPTLDIETMLIRDPSAVRDAFDEVLSQETPEGVDIEAWRREWPSERIAEFIRQRLEEKPDRPGSGVLTDLAWIMGHLTYRKTVHDPRIAARVDPQLLPDLRAILASLMTLDTAS
jgi:hypothetical protein